jgi:signal transducing adaptor molecule
VQLYALTLCDALSKNAGAAAHRELASRAFTETLRRLFGDRNVHVTVKRKAWALLREWGREWGESEEGGMLVETIESLKSQSEWARARERMQR